MDLLRATDSTPLPAVAGESLPRDRGSAVLMPERQCFVSLHGHEIDHTLQFIPRSRPGPGGLQHKAAKGLVGLSQRCIRRPGCTVNRPPKNEMSRMTWVRTLPSPRIKSSHDSEHNVTHPLPAAPSRHSSILHFGMMVRILLITGQSEGFYVCSASSI